MKNTVKVNGFWNIYRDLRLTDRNGVYQLHYLRKNNTLLTTKIKEDRFLLNIEKNYGIRTKSFFLCASL